MFALWNCCNARVHAYKCFLFTTPPHFGFATKETTCILLWMDAPSILYHGVHSIRQTVSEHNSSHNNSIVAYSVLFHYLCVTYCSIALQFHSVHSNSPFNYLQHPSSLHLISFPTTQGGVKTTTQSQEWRKRRSGTNSHPIIRSHPSSKGCFIPECPLWN